LRLDPGFDADDSMMFLGDTLGLQLPDLAHTIMLDILELPKATRVAVNVSPLKAEDAR